MWSGRLPMRPVPKHCLPDPTFPRSSLAPPVSGASPTQHKGQIARIVSSCQTGDVSSPFPALGRHCCAATIGRHHIAKCRPPMHHVPRRSGPMTVHVLPRPKPCGSSEIESASFQRNTRGATGHLSRKPTTPAAGVIDQSERSKAMRVRLVPLDICQ